MQDILDFIFLDNNMHYTNIIVSIICGIFIYNRKLNYYRALPRHNIFVSLFIFIWTYVSLQYSKWFIPLGLVLLNYYDAFLSKIIMD